LSLIERYAEQPVIVPAQVVAILRETLFSNSFATLATARSLANPHNISDAAPFEARFDKALWSLVGLVRHDVERLLDDREEEELAEAWTTLVDRLDTSDPEEPTLDGSNLASTVDYMPTVFAVLRSKSDPRHNLIQSWLVERSKDKEMLAAVIETLSQGKRESRSAGSAPSPMIRTPGLEESSGHASNGTANVSPPPIARAPSSPQAPPPPAHPPANSPACELPTDSILAGIDGIDTVGENDSRRPVGAPKGNIGVDKRAGMSPEMREKVERAERREAEKRDKMLKAGLKPDPSKRPPKKGS
jgi:hypothetical protein